MSSCHDFVRRVNVSLFIVCPVTWSCCSLTSSLSSTQTEMCQSCSLNTRRIFLPFIRVILTPAHVGGNVEELVLHWSKSVFTVLTVQVNHDPVSSFEMNHLSYCFSLLYMHTSKIFMSVQLIHTDICCVFKMLVLASLYDLKVFLRQSHVICWKDNTTSAVIFSPPSSTDILSPSCCRPCSVVLLKAAFSTLCLYVCGQMLAPP